MDTNSNELPTDLLALGFKIVHFASGRMCATSQSFGCSDASTDLQEVIRTARSIARWCQDQNRLRARRDAARRAADARGMSVDDVLELAEREVSEED